MSKINQVKHRLRTDPNGMLAWMDGGCLPQVSYESAEITGIQLSLMLEGCDDVYILSILPGDEYGQFDAWLRRMGSDDMTHMLTKRARDPEDVVVAALGELPEFIGLVKILFIPGCLAAAGYHTGSRDGCSKHSYTFPGAQGLGQENHYVSSK